MATHRYLRTTAAAAGDGQANVDSNQGDGHWAYNTLSAAEAGIPATLDAGTGVWEIEITVGTTADTTVATFTGTTTTAAYYIKVYTSGTARHAGVWSTGAYRLDVSATTSAIDLVADLYVTLDGLQVGLSAASGNDYIKIINAQGTTTLITVQNCIVRGVVTGTAGASGVWGIIGYNGLNCANNIVYGCHNAGNTVGCGIYLDAGGTIYNNTVAASYTGVVDAWSGAVWSNNIVQGATGAAYTHGNGTGTCNLSNDTTAFGTVTYKSKTVTFAAGGYLLDSTDTEAINKGSDLTTSMTSLFGSSADILGVTRPTGANTWDLGAHEYVAEGGEPTPIEVSGAGVTDAKATPSDSVALFKAKMVSVPADAKAAPSDSLTRSMTMSANVPADAKAAYADSATKNLLHPIVQSMIDVMNIG